jgi:tRNA 2-selenouridine synthase
MDWLNITAREGLQRLKRGACALDVRSPIEFAHAAIPGFANIPILNDLHRSQVGLAYKEQGQDAAIELGLKLVTPLREQLVKNWQQVLDPASVDMRLLICWRGGLRSKMTAEWLSEAKSSGVRVSGGYKAMRAELIGALSKPPEFLVVGGLTGAGKTQMLRELPQASVVDLELLANHRGSSFGLKMKASQPAQQTFENAVGLKFFEAAPIMAVEAESRMIGNCVIPAEIKSAMDRSPLVVLESTMAERVERIFIEYVSDPMKTAGAAPVALHLNAALKRVERRLGGLRYQEIKRLLDGAFFHRELKLETHAPWIEALLREYYDPLYEFSLKEKGREVAFRGDIRAVQAYLVDHLKKSFSS